MPKSASTWHFRGVGVVHPDGTHMPSAIGGSTLVGEVLHRVLMDLDVVEVYYFGLNYTNPNKGARIWLDPKSKLWPQIRDMEPPYRIHLGVQYLPSTVSIIKEDVTRNLIYQYLRNEVLSNSIPCCETDRADLLAWVYCFEIGCIERPTVYHHQQFFHLAGEIPHGMMNTVMEYYSRISTAGPLQAESVLITLCLELVTYSPEPYRVLTNREKDPTEVYILLKPSGLTISSPVRQLETIFWAEIQKAGYWGRVFSVTRSRAQDKTKHRFQLPTREACRELWKLFRKLFRFYCTTSPVSEAALVGRTSKFAQRVSIMEYRNNSQHALFPVQSTVLTNQTSSLSRQTRLNLPLLST